MRSYLYRVPPDLKKVWHVFCKWDGANEPANNSNWHRACQRAQSHFFKHINLGAGEIVLLGFNSLG